MQKKNSAKRSERLAVASLSLIFLLTAAFATAKYIFRAPDLDTDIPSVPTEVTPEDSSADVGAELPNARERRENCFTILVNGLDDDNGGSDTNILVRFDASGGRIDLVSLPRDTLLHNDYSNNKLNYTYARGGMELLQGEIENLLGVPVDRYVTIDLKGFIAVVDQIGGVDLEIPIDMDYDDPYQDLHIHFTKGLRHLNGQEAMEVVRFRHNNDGTGYGTEDIGRIGTQQAFLKAVAKQLLRAENVKNIPALVDIFCTYVKTDLSAGNIVWFANEALDIGLDNIYFHTLPGDGAGYYHHQSVYTLDADATLALINEALNPYTQPLTREDTDILVP